MGRAPETSKRARHQRCAESGSPKDLYDKYGLSGPRLADTIAHALATPR